LECGLRLANAQHLSGKRKEALSTIDALRMLPSPMRDDPRLDLAEANSALRLPDFPRALAATERAVQKARAQSTPLVLAHALKIQGDVLNDSVSDTNRALAVMEEARSLYEAAGDRGAVASILNNIALVHYRRGNLAEAHRLYQESIAGCRAIGHVSCAGYSV
jgi:tetratricopeptide (TPR) repeat protein